MQNFTWHNPTALIFGKDTVKELAPRLKADGIKGVLLVFGGKERSRAVHILRLRRC